MENKNIFVTFKNGVSKEMSTPNFSYGEFGEEFERDQEVLLLDDFVSLRNETLYRVDFWGKRIDIEDCKAREVWLAARSVSLRDCVLVYCKIVAEKITLENCRCHGCSFIGKVEHSSSSFEEGNRGKCQINGEEIRSK